MARHSELSELSEKVPHLAAKWRKLAETLCAEKG